MRKWLKIVEELFKSKVNQDAIAAFTKKKILSGIVSKIETVSPEKPLLPESRFWHSLLSGSAFCLRSLRKTRSHRPLPCSQHFRSRKIASHWQNRSSRPGNIVFPPRRFSRQHFADYRPPFNSKITAQQLCIVECIICLAERKKKKKESILICSLISTVASFPRKKYRCPFSLSNVRIKCDLSFRRI